MDGEILFRAKRSSNNEWVYGMPKKSTPHRIEFDAISMYDKWEKDGKAWYAPVMAFIVPETVGQYTGKDDKNGKKIFAGDIVLVSYLANGEIIEERVLVSRDNETTAFVPWSWQYNCDGCECGLEIQEINVIGNFYDNPELLSG